MFQAVCSALVVAILAFVPAAGGGPLYRLDPDVVYGHKMGMALTYDVIAPAGGNGAGVLFMVSGGWISTWADPQEVLGRWPVFSTLIERGYTLFLVRHGSSPLFKVPDAVADVRSAVHHIRAHAGQWRVDRERLGVFGGSAGGHLSLMLGTATETDRVAAVVAYFPPVDLRTIAGPNERFPALDFDPELADDVSPLLFVTKGDPPTLLVHGDADTLVPLANSQRILEAFQREGVPAELVVIAGGGHGFRDTQHEQKAAAALVDWFERHLAPAAAAAPTGSSP